MRICIFHNSQQELKEYRNGITVFYLFLVIVISCHVYGMVYGIWCDGILVTRNMVLNVVLMLFMTNHIHPSQTYHWLMCLLVLVLYLQKLSDCNGNWSFWGLVINQMGIVSAAAPRKECLTRPSETLNGKILFRTRIVGTASAAHNWWKYASHRG